MKNCNQCGKCCIKYGAQDLSASSDDIAWWDQHRPHIYQYVNNGKIWISPENKDPLDRCPWLRQQDNNVYTCDIYYDRPEDCRLYPSTINEMIEDQCEMIEPIDLTDLKSAQAKLNRLMMDSRK